MIDTKYKIAHMLPVFCRQAHAIIRVGEVDIGNEYMAAMDQVPDLEAFAAVICSSNVEYELAEGIDEIRAANLEQPKSPSGHRSLNPRSLHLPLNQRK